MIAMVTLRIKFYGNLSLLVCLCTARGPMPRAALSHCDGDHDQHHVHHLTFSGNVCQSRCQAVVDILYMVRKIK